MVTWEDRPGGWGATGGFRLQQTRSGLWAHTPLVWGAPKRAKTIPRDRQTDRGGHPALGWGDPSPRAAGEELNQQAGGVGGGHRDRLRCCDGRAYFPTCVFRFRASCACRPGWAAHIWRSARCVGSRLPSQAWPPASASGAAGRVPEPRAEVAERGPQARGETDITPGSGVQSPPGPRWWASDASC